MNKKLKLYLAMRWDGYIAKMHDSIYFLSPIEMPGEDVGFHDFLKQEDLNEASFSKKALHSPSDCFSFGFEPTIKTHPGCLNG